MGLFRRSDQRRRAAETRREFDQHFKSRAVRRVYETGWGCLDEVARNLGIDRGMLVDWLTSDWGRELQQKWRMSDEQEREFREHRGS